MEEPRIEIAYAAKEECFRTEFHRTARSTYKSPCKGVTQDMKNALHSNEKNSVVRNCLKERNQRNETNEVSQSKAHLKTQNGKVSNGYVNKELINKSKHNRKQYASQHESKTSVNNKLIKNVGNNTEQSEFPSRHSPRCPRNPKNLVLVHELHSKVRGRDCTLVKGANSLRPQRTRAVSSVRTFNYSGTNNNASRISSITSGSRVRGRSEERRPNKFTRLPILERSSNLDLRSVANDSSVKVHTSLQRNKEDRRKLEKSEVGKSVTTVEGSKSPAKTTSNYPSIQHCKESSEHASSSRNSGPKTIQLCNDSSGHLNKYDVPPANAKLVRSKSNLGESDINKWKQQDHPSKNVASQATNHIYDTIGTCGCHKYAIERIDSVLRNSESALEINSANYDVPKPIRDINAEALTITHLSRKLRSPSHIISDDSTTKTHNCIRCDDERLSTSNRVVKEHKLFIPLSSSDSDSSATYATIDGTSRKNKEKMRHRLGTEPCKEIIDGGNKLRTLDIKEERRKTPDIVKCSRRPYSAQDTSRNALGLYKEGGNTSYSSSSGRGSDAYLDLSPPSTVIHMPVKKSIDLFQNQKNISSDSGFSDTVKATDKDQTNSGHNVDLTSVPYEEIYSVVEDWPSDTTNKHLGEMYSSNNSDYRPTSHNQNHMFHPSQDNHFNRSDTLSQKYNKSHNIPHQDVPKNAVAINSVTVRPQLSQPTKSCENCKATSSTVTVCSSVSDLCSLLKSDPNSPLLVYKVDPQQNESNPSGVATVLILPNLNGVVSDVQSKLGGESSAHSPVSPPSATPTADTRTPNSSVVHKNDSKMSFFRKFRKNPSTKTKDNTKSASTNMFKSKSVHNLFADKSEGVTFIEPNYDPTEPKELLSDEQKESLCFDYSSSWQNLRFIKQSPY